jgi:hypothetical protein
VTAIDESAHSGRVRELRRQGLAPKKIARDLGLRPSEVIGVLNQSATPVSVADEQAGVRCWVSRGWANEVRVNGHDEWPGLDDDVESPGGLVCVLVARRHRNDKVSVCGYLVDVHCLGVKNTLGPDVMDEVDLIAFRRHFFGAYGDHVPAPLELARQLVLGAVQYARGLGFEPHSDYTGTVGHLGDPLSGCDIEFGRDGMPFFVEGPYDDAREIMQTLDKSVGPGNYHFLQTLPLSAIGA